MFALQFISQQFNTQTLQCETNHHTDNLQDQLRRPSFGACLAAAYITCDNACCLSKCYTAINATNLVTVHAWLRKYHAVVTGRLLTS